jgi:hypothetical protein
VWAAQNVFDEVKGQTQQITPEKLKEYAFKWLVVPNNCKKSYRS